MNTVIAFSFCLVMALAVMTQANSDPEALRDDTNQLQADTGLFEASEDVAELRKREDQNPEGRRGKLESVEGDNKKKSKSPRKPEGMNKKKKNDKKPRKLKTKKKNNNGKVPRKLKTKKKNDKGPRKLKTKKNNGKGLRKLKTKKNNGKGPRKLKNNNGKGPRKLKKKGENTRTMNRKPKKNRKPIELRGRPSKTKKLERTHKLPEIFKLPKIKNRKNLKGVNVRDDTNNKRECKPKRKCNALSGECRQKSSGCNAGEVEATGKGKFCSKSTCVCCYTDDGSCANTKKCDKKGGTCQASDSGCAKFKTGTKWCSGTGCGCCFGGTSTCKAKKKCKNMNGVCQSSSATCSGAVYTKGFCKGGSDCVCCVKEDPVTPAPITPAPKTPAPNTKAPTTKAPTTKAPTTKAPTTKAPTTKAPTTKAPTTKAPTTKAPTTKAPSTKVPTTKAPTTKAPTTKAPTTKAPTTKAPITKAPTTKAPTTKAPTTKAPTTAPATTTTSKCPRPYCDPCGVAPINVASSRIVGGVDASPGEFPYQVFIVTTIAGSSYSCGGSIIKKKWILTAAHCFFDQQNVKASSVAVFLGSHKRDSATEVPVTKFITHETYDPANGAEEEDIALIELKNDLVFDANISPICLAEETDIIAGGKSIVTGWGDLKFGSTDPTPNTLQEVALDVISVTECGTKIGLPTDTKKVVCTLTPDKDSCQGDSGGPLVVKLCDGRYAQIGIVSYGDGCAKPNSPGVYANVPNYLTWINTNTGSTTC